MLSIQLWISALLVVWIYVLWSRRRFYQLMMKLPGPIGYPLLGILNRFWGENAALNVLGFEITKRGSIWLSWFGPIPTLFVADPQIAQEVLTSPYSMNKAKVAYNVMEEILGNGLVVLKDPLWSMHRKAFSPAFGHNILLSFLTVFNNETGSLLQELDALVGKGEQDLVSLLKNFTLRITSQTVMGSGIKKEENYKNIALMKSYNRLLKYGTKLVSSPWLNNRLMRYLTGMGNVINEENSTIRKLIKKLVDTKLETDSELNDPSDSQKNILLKLATGLFKSGVFSYQDIIDELHQFIIAAFETSALTIGYTLMNLAMFPEYQERVYEEIRSVFPNTGDFEVTYEDIQKLEYLDMVLNENMRLWPTFPIIARQITKDVKLSNGVVLPEGLQIVFSIFHMHRNKDSWGHNAEIFNPENCRPQNLKDKHPYAFMPFSKGKRNCIGWKYAVISMKVALVKILRNFQFTSSYRIEDLTLVNNVSLKFKNVACMEIRRR